AAQPNVSNVPPVPPPQPTPAQAPQPFQPYPSMPGQVPTPPAHNTPYAPPPAPQQQPPPPQPQTHIPNQEELLQQVLNMPQATVDALPEAERSQVMLLRQQLMQGGMR